MSSEIKVDTISENTSANGVAVDGVTLKDGAITSTAASTITVADNSDNLTLKSTDADANAGPNLILQRDSGSPADGDAIGRIDFDADNDAGEVTSFFSIRAEIEDASDGAEDGQMKIDQIIAGTAVTALRFKSSETVFNDDSKDVDFRVETNANTHGLFVDGGTNNVCIGTSAPIMSGYDSSSTKLCVHDSSGSAQSGYLELSAATNTNGHNVGAIQFANNENADATNLDADGKVVATIRTVLRTSDSNAGDDSGGTIEFYTKNEAASLTARQYIYYNGNFQFMPGSNGHGMWFDGGVDSFYPITNDNNDLGYANLKWDDVYATNGTIQTSDKNVKDNITTSDLGLDFVNKLKPVSYKFKEKTRTHYGLIAQDIEDVLSDISKSTIDFAGFIKTQKEDHSVWTKDDPETQGDNPTAEIGQFKNPIGTKIDDEYSYALRYEEFISPMIKAIQELAVKVKALEDA